MRHDIHDSHVLVHNCAISGHELNVPSALSYVTLVKQLNEISKERLIDSLVYKRVVLSNIILKQKMSV